MRHTGELTVAMPMPRCVPLSCYDDSSYGTRHVSAYQIVAHPYSRSMRHCTFHNHPKKYTDGAVASEVLTRATARARHAVPLRRKLRGTLCVKAWALRKK